LNAPFLDRRVPGELLHELRDGVFGWVTDLARESLDARRPLDLGLRKDSKTQQAHATLYLGTTKVLDVIRGRAGTFKLKSEAQGGEFSAIPEPFEKAWTRAQPLKHLARDMPRIR